MSIQSSHLAGAMEVIVQSLLQNEAQGQATVPCHPEDTVDSLISAFCVEKGVRQKRDYVLRTSHNDVLINTNKIKSYDVHNGAILYLTTRDSGREQLLGCNNWWLLALVTLLIGTIGLIAISVLMALGDIVPDRYGIIIDAGSTHSEVLVYVWWGDKCNGTGLVEQVSACRADVPISAFADRPAEAGASLRSCLDTVTAEAVPNSVRSTTSIYLGATAGMRVLNRTDPVAVTKILESVRKTVRSYGFMCEDDNVRIITGREEGAYAWVTVNYIKGTFGMTMAHHKRTEPLPVAHTQASFGALDLGGSSTQITFEPRIHPQTIPPEYVEPLLMYGKTYHVFTDSFLCYGKSMAHLRFLATLAIEQNKTTVTNPCFPTGFNMTIAYHDLFSSPCARGPDAISVFGRHLQPPYGIVKNSTFTFMGQSNSIVCQVKVRQMFDSKNCPYGTRCSWNQHYLAPFTGKFMAFSGFYWILHGYNFTDPHLEDRSLSAFQKAVVVLCTKSWDQIKTIPFDRPAKAAYNCFDGLYVITMLTKGGYHFNDTTWDDIAYVDKVDGTSTGWAMGYMLNQTNDISATVPQKRIDIPVFISLLIIFAVLLALSIAFACYAKKTSAGLAGYKPLDGYGSV